MRSNKVKNASGSFVRPADTTQYAVGDLVANSTTGGSVAAMELAFGEQGGLRETSISRVILYKTSVGVTTADFRVHMYTADPTATNGDNAAWLTDNVAAYLGSADVTIDRVFSDGASGAGSPVNLVDIPAVLTSGKIYALLEARGTYTPVSAETFTLVAEGYEK